MIQPTTEEYDPESRFCNVNNAAHMTLAQAQSRARKLGEHCHKVHCSKEQYVIAFFDGNRFLGYILEGHNFND